MRIVFSVAILGCGFGACKQGPVSNLSSDVQSLHKVVVQKPILVFSWSNSQQAQNPTSFIKAQTAAAQDCLKGARTNRGESACMGGAAGAGFYLAFDPFVSRDYGNTLIVSEIARGAEIVVTGEEWGWDPQDQVSKDVLLSGANMIAYPFVGASFQSVTGGDAIVVREFAGLDLSRTRAVMRVQSGLPLSKHAPFSCSETTPLEEIVRNWGDHMDILHASASEPELPNNPEGAQRFKPYRLVWNNEITETGVAFALLSDAVAQGLINESWVANLKKESKAWNMAIHDCRSRSAVQVTDSQCFAASFQSSTVLSPNSRRGVGLMPVDVTYALKRLGFGSVANSDSVETVLRSVREHYTAVSTLQRFLEARACGAEIKRQLKASGKMKAE